MVNGNELVSSQPVSYDVFDKTPESWKKIADKIEALNIETFGMNPLDPVLGISDDRICYPDLKSAFLASDTTTIVAKRGDEPIGYALAMPLEKFGVQEQDSLSADEIQKANYFYFLAFTKGERQKFGHLSGLMENLFVRLMEIGRPIVVADGMKRNGWADKVKVYLEGQHMLLRTPFEHELWPSIGPEIHFVFDVSKSLKRT